MQPKSIVTLTPNPAVDLCTSIDHVIAFHKLRCGEARRDPGGGGINVARVIRRLGGNPVAIFPAGGPIGGLLQKLLASETINGIAVAIAGDTREDITIDEQKTGAQFRFVLPGPVLWPDEIAGIFRAVKSNSTRDGFLVASGSLPPGMDAKFYAEISRIAETAGMKFVIDSSGPALAAALEAGAFLVKPSLRELRELTGEALTQERAWVDAARALTLRHRVEWVALTLGEMGALLVSDKVSLRATAPKVTPVSTVGAGDSFLGALVWGLARGEDVQTALRFAVASGTAAMLSPGTDLSHPADIERLVAKVEVHELKTHPAFA
jgi:6-phosphofructokinase 2